MTIDEIVERAIPLRGIECPTKKAEAVIRRRQLKRDIASYAEMYEQAQVIEPSPLIPVTLTHADGKTSQVEVSPAYLNQMEQHVKPFI